MAVTCKLGQCWWPVSQAGSGDAVEVGKVRGAGKELFGGGCVAVPITGKVVGLIPRDQI